MSTQVKLNVTFQSKVGDGVECSPEKILLHATDMKALKVKIGGAVLVEMPASVCLCRAWPSKKAVVGSGTLNKMWAPNFPADLKKIKVSLMPQARLIQCATISFLLVGKPQEVDLLASSNFKDLLKAMLANTPMRVGLMFGFTLRCQYHILKVESCTAEDGCTAIGDDSDAEVFHLVHSGTKLSIESPQDGNPKDTTQIDNIHAATLTGKQKIDRFTTAIRTQFAGYQNEVVEALGTACLGLGGKYQLIRTSENGSSNDGKILSWPPKGMILYGPPGTGKSCLMRGLVSALGCEHVELSHNILLSRFEGEAERAVTSVFQEAAAKAPCCVLIDNMDLLCYSRTAAGASELQKRVVACMLTLMDGLGGGAAGGAGDAGASAGTGMQGVFVIGTTARIGDIDPAVRRAGRIDKEVEIGVPSSGDRESILQHLLLRAGVSVGAPGDATEQTALPLSTVHEVAKLAHGMVGSDLLSVVKEAFYLTLRDSNSSSAGGAPMPDASLHNDNGDVTPQKSLADGVVAGEEDMDQLIGSLASEFEDLDVEQDAAIPETSSEMPPQPLPALPPLTVTSTTAAANQGVASPSQVPVQGAPLITESALRRAVGKISPSALREVVIEVPSVRWGDIGGMEGVKQSLREVVEWPLLHPELFATLGISPPKGVLLYGPPGCSKTLMAKALATESSMNFLAVRGPELLSKWLGESEKAVQALFRRARAAAPSIIFFDEIDALAGKRGDVSSGVSDRVLSQLLTELDGVHGLKQVIVIAATNRPDMLDAALVRPGRIDRKIYVPPPDEGSREQILKLELKKMPLQGEFDYAELVTLTAGFSGAEIVGACSEAAMLAIEEDCAFLHPRHLLTAVRSVKPQITETMLQFYKSCAANL